MKNIILASGSPRRRELLAQIGVDYEVHKAEGEENITSSDPLEAVKRLSMQKASEVLGSLEREGWQGDAVIGADTVVALDGVILGKPKDEEDARRMLRFLQGREHEVITGVTVLLPRLHKEVCFAEVTRVHFCPMDEREIRLYVESGEPMDKAGAYGIQGEFAAYVSSVEGDFYNVVGLPVCRLYQEVRSAGYDLKGEKYL